MAGDDKRKLVSSENIADCAGGVGFFNGSCKGTIAFCPAQPDLSAGGQNFPAKIAIAP